MFTRKSGKMRKKVFSIVLIILSFCFMGCSKSNSNIDEYLNSGEVIDNFAKSFMPSIEKLPESKSVEYRYTNNSIIISQSDSIALVVSYDNLTYEKEKEKLDNILSGPSLSQSQPAEQTNTHDSSIKNLT